MMNMAISDWAIDRMLDNDNNPSMNSQTNNGVTMIDFEVLITYGIGRQCRCVVTAEDAWDAAYSALAKNRDLVDRENIPPGRAVTLSAIAIFRKERQEAIL